MIVFLKIFTGDIHPEVVMNEVDYDTSKLRFIIKGTKIKPEKLTNYGIYGYNAIFFDLDIDDLYQEIFTKRQIISSIKKKYNFDINLMFVGEGRLGNGVFIDASMLKLICELGINLDFST